MEEDGWWGEDPSNKFVGDNQKYEKIEQELERVNQRRNKSRNWREEQRELENNKWEINRMLGSGMYRLGEHIHQQLDEEEDSRVMLMVHDIKPPFLDGKKVFTTQMEMVKVVKDISSDIAVLSKKGSQVLKDLRERNERSKMRERFWELAGTQIGNVLK